MLVGKSCRLIWLWGYVPLMPRTIGKNKTLFQQWVGLALPKTKWKLTSDKPMISPNKSQTQTLKRLKPA